MIIVISLTSNINIIKIMDFIFLNYLNFILYISYTHKNVFFLKKSINNFLCLITKKEHFN